MTDTLTVQELTDLRLGTLKTAVDDWKTMASRLERLATGGGDVSASDLEKKAKRRTGRATTQRCHASS